MVSSPSNVNHLEPAQSELSEISGKRTKELIEWLRDYAQRRINSRLMDERRCITPNIVLDFGKQGLLGMIVPESQGGLGLTYHDMLKIIEQCAGIDLNLSSFVAVHNVLGIYPILKYGTKEQKEKYLNCLAQGRDLAAFGLTEPDAGSNPRGIKTEAIPDGKDGWLMSGTKIWIGTASWSSVINVFAQVVDEQGKSLGVTAFAIPENAKGLKQGHEFLTIGMRGMVQNAIHFDQVTVSSENILGEIGNGFEVAQDAMRLGRLAIAAMCVGGMKRCAQLMLRYASRRSLGVDKLIHKPITLERLSDLTAAIGAVECLVKTMSQWLDQDIPVPEEAFLTAKIIAPELMWQAADQLVQLLGGRGYIESNIAPQILRDARVMRIFEGPTETLQARLGLLALYYAPKLCSSLNELLGVSNINIELNKAVDFCKAQINTQNLSKEDKQALRQIYQQKLGDLVSWAFMLACLQKSNRNESTDEQKRIEKWTEEHFRAKLSTILQESPLKSTLLSETQVESLIEKYIETIGDVEQTLPGENTELDEYLLKY
ncbi:acyl-CoA dehydrogenase family protein [Crocosphaera sp.]|uniref:acyl-CoA dehydrogenase family protein n=1 Tax=Crocosphaera sp. TaxID=2729996 RepID=UPI002635AD48|nr:acyl-CoA dehydrogenase family protein [Crocosphaera sp.]MDJ0582974.1 acyl-CoA dehydrogenase family protein [Crocosphaera sp.]